MNTNMGRNLYERYGKICDVLILGPQFTRKTTGSLYENKK
jgi:hypothetical protein